MKVWGLIFARVPWRVWLVLGGVLCVALVLISVYWAGVTNERRDTALERAQDERQTQERINNADVGVGDPVDDDNWLRNRGQR